MRIELLADRPDVIPALVLLFESAWSAYYVDGPGHARQDLEARCNRQRLPVGLVALEGDTILGAAAVGRDAATGHEPAVIGLVVAPEYRGRGVANALFAACESLAIALACDRLYTSSSVLENLLLRRGWIKGKPVRFADGSQGSAYHIDLI